MKVTVSAVRKLLRNLAFDPRKPGHLKPIIEVGNPDYYLSRAAEMIMEARALPSRAGRRITNTENAITLLSLALLHECPETQFEGTVGR